jgi:hypothetical protein
MNAFWAYFWLPLAAGLALGLIGGLLAFRRKTKMPVIIAAVVTCLAAVAWHGPLGAADRLTKQIESISRMSLNSYEMPMIASHLHHGPLTRAIQLSGPADDFQRSELALIQNQIPGVSFVSWTGESGLPLIVEGLIASLLGFLIGGGLAYGVERRRCYNAQWTW